MSPGLSADILRSPHHQEYRLPILDWQPVDQDLYSPSSIAACGLPICPASWRIGGTAGSETNCLKPSGFQSRTTQTRSASPGSRYTLAPLDPCSFLFSAPLVEKILMNW